MPVAQEQPLLGSSSGGFSDLWPIRQVTAWIERVFGGPAQPPLPSFIDPAA